MLERAKLRLGQISNVELVCADIDFLPFSEGTFRHIFMFTVLPGHTDWDYPPASLHSPAESDSYSQIPLGHLPQQHRIPKSSRIVQGGRRCAASKNVQDGSALDRFQEDLYLPTANHPDSVSALQREIEQFGFLVRYATHSLI
jgi:hypothetical protein